MCCVKCVTLSRIELTHSPEIAVMASLAAVAPVSNQESKRSWSSSDGSVLEAKKKSIMFTESEDGV